MQKHSSTLWYSEQESIIWEVSNAHYCMQNTCAESHMLGMQLSIISIYYHCTHYVHANCEDFCVTVNFEQWNVVQFLRLVQRSSRHQGLKRGKKRPPGKENREPVKTNQHEQCAICDAVLNTDKVDVLSSVLHDEAHKKDSNIHSCPFQEKLCCGADNHIECVVTNLSSHHLYSTGTRGFMYLPDPVFFYHLLSLWTRKLEQQPLTKASRYMASNS